LIPLLRVTRKACPSNRRTPANRTSRRASLPSVHVAFPDSRSIFPSSGPRSAPRLSAAGIPPARPAPSRQPRPGRNRRPYRSSSPRRPGWKSPSALRLRRSAGASSSGRGQNTPPASACADIANAAAAVSSTVRVFQTLMAFPWTEDMVRPASTQPRLYLMRSDTDKHYKRSGRCERKRDATPVTRTTR
jgi:hypothetical protein